MEQRLGVLVFIRNHVNRFLLIHHVNDDSWGFVSGAIEAGEDEKSTVLREAYEEIGVKMIKDLLKPHDFNIVYDTDRYHGVYKTFSYILDDLQVVKLQSPEEVDEYGWFDEEEARRLIADKPVLISGFDSYLQQDLG